MQLTPVVCLAANMANAECQAWVKHTASATADTQEMRATKVREKADACLEGMRVDIFNFVDGELTFHIFSKKKNAFSAVQAFQSRACFSKTNLF